MSSGRSRLPAAALFCLALAVAADSPPAPAGEDARRVKLLHGFEPEELGASADPAVLEKRGWKFIGKAWTEGEPKPGWRVKDHLDELRLPAGYDGPVTLYEADSSRDYPRMTFCRTGATQGKYSRLAKFGEGGWSYVKSYSAGNFTGLTAQPSKTGYHDIRDWFYQRYGSVFDSALGDRYERHDWSGYELLRLDFYSEGAPAVVAIRAFDASGPKIPAQYLGLRTALAVYKLPKDKQVTAEFPLGALARAAEMDLAKMTGIVIRVNGYEGEPKLYFDNIRLVAGEAADQDAKHPIIKMEGEVGPYARPVLHKPAERNADKLKRKSGPVDRLGPVVVYQGKAGYSSAGTLLGGSGTTYFQSLRRGCVAYDHDRLLVYFGGYLASASFDGGKTWGGLQPGQDGPTALGWGGDYRGTASADGADLYFLGTENCSSYHEGYGTVFRRLAMTGPGWTDDRVSLVDQNLRKCPPDMRAWRLDSGRIWATIADGFGGITAKHSDDDGYTWAPCKDASLPPPRPFHEPRLEDLGKPAAERPTPPKAVLPWPGEPVCGSVLLPYKGQMAVLGQKEWQVHDGKAWGAARKLPLGAPGRGSVIAIGDRIFVAQGGQYGDLEKGCKPAPLVVAEFDGGEWTQQTLEAGDVGDAILSASGRAAFLFYVKYAGENKVNEVRVRRWAGGKWGESELVAKEELRINRLAAPIVSAPDYAAVWWDTVPEKGGEKVLRFAKLPNL